MDALLSGDLVRILGIVFFVSFGLCALVAAFPALFAVEEEMIKDAGAVQSLHCAPTPRIGGIGVVFAIAVGYFWSSPTMGADLTLAMISGIAVFAVGLREDIARDMSPKPRLLAAFVSAFLAIALTGHYVDRINLIGIDWLLTWMPVGLLLTSIWSAGMCHSLNLLDGINGLASGFAMMASFALFLVAGFTGDTDIQFFSLVLFAALFGFFVLNWPFGRIFLGDGGAYFVGHALAWISIFLIARNPDVAGISMILLVFWPVADTAFAIIRRRIRKKATHQPDRLHFHHLVVRGLRIMLPGSKWDGMHNPLATIVMMPFIALTVIAGVWFWDAPMHAVVSMMLFSILFLASYFLPMSFFRGRRFNSVNQAGSFTKNFSPQKWEFSKYSRKVLCGETELEVEIARKPGQSHWRLNISNDGSVLRAFPNRFPSDKAAWEYFIQSVQPHPRKVLGLAVEENST